LSNKDVEFGLCADEKMNGVIFGGSFSVMPLFSRRHSKHFFEHAGVSNEDTAGELVQRLTDLVGEMLNWLPRLRPEKMIRTRKMQSPKRSQWMECRLNGVNIDMMWKVGGVGCCGPIFLPNMRLLTLNCRAEF
jgi:hypothetical protein